jgi:hypothetical protein
MSDSSALPATRAESRRWTGRNLPRQTGGFTLTEVMISMLASVAILAALLLTTISLRRGLHSNETYTGAYSDQRRVTDYIGRDLRRAVGVAYTNEAGERCELTDSATVVNIADRASLIVTLPGYYRSNTRNDNEYDAALEVVGNQERLDYGTAGSLAPTVEVTFRKMFFAKENCVCFVRREADTEEVIVRRADNLFVQVTIEAGAQSSSIKTWFRSRDLGPAPLVTTHDRLLLRNPPLTYRP